MRRLKPVLLAATLGFATAVSGCGDSGAPGRKAASDSRGVIASASDCISFGEQAVKACAAAIEKAVSKHEASAKSYPDLSLCEKDVGPQKCERAASGRYRARLSAFMVVIGATTRAEPLYPAAEGGIGFQTADKTKVLAEDRSFAFSSLALSVAEMQAAHGKGDRRRKRL